MPKGAILLLVGTVVFVGWIAPSLPVPNSAVRPVAPVAASTGSDSKAEARHEAWLTGGTVLDRESDGHFYADAQINQQRPTHFLVDTGASMVALTGQDARAIGLTWTDSQLQPVGRGASGTVYGVPVKLDRVDLGGFAAQDISAAIIPQGLEVSLLGQSFLTRLNGVRIERDRMVLGGQ